MRSSSDLREYLEALDLCYFRRHLEEMGVTIGWLPSKDTRQGLYTFDARRIQINRRLAHEWVPECFVLHVIYHEGLHAIHGPESADHPPAFFAAERQFALAFDSLMWEREHGVTLLEAPVPKGLR